MKKPIEEGPAPVPTPTGPGDAPVTPADTARAWKARAEEAEKLAAELRERVAELEAMLEEAGAGMRTVTRRHAIEREVGGLGAVDLETALMLVEAALGAMEDPDAPEAVTLAVRDVRSRKPFLFAPAGPRPVPGVAMSPVDERTEDRLGALASGARASGDRGALLRYLRQRRVG
jgi:hypothetical protein